MLRRSTLDGLEVSGRPLGQRIWGSTALYLNYEWFPGVDIQLVDTDKICEESAIIAMNHTDRFNYWPFQYQLWRDLNRFTGTWVKGKYYQNKFISKLLEITNNIPTVSKGYIITSDFKALFDRRPENDEYRFLRDRVDAVDEQGTETDRRQPQDKFEILKPLFTESRDLLEYPFDPDKESYEEAVLSLYREMMSRFVELNVQAIERGADLLIFPEGTRSRRLKDGRLGLAEMATYLEVPIIPVGCNGSDRVYPGDSPWAKAGKITYRIGDPISVERVREVKPDEDFTPFIDRPGDRSSLKALTEDVMERINRLLDPEYQREESTGVEDGSKASRFI